MICWQDDVYRKYLLMILIIMNNSASGGCYNFRILKYAFKFAGLGIIFVIRIATDMRSLSIKTTIVVRYVCSSKQLA